jgi:hypothetical protein
MPVIMPKENATPIANLELKELLGKTPKIQDFPPTLRTMLRDGNLPKAPPFQPVVLNPSNPKRTSTREEIPNMV